MLALLMLLASGMTGDSDLSRWADNELVTGEKKLVVWLLGLLEE